MALRPGEQLGPYEIVSPLGAGGMGEVYRARDPRLKRDVALKVLAAPLASDPECLGRFEREAQALAALNHPHIVTIHSVEEADALRFLTMELVEGRTLSRVIPRGGLPLSQFFQIAVPLTDAVSAAHEKGIIHRDLKPGNVMVTEDGRVKVLDFGLAKLREADQHAVDTQSPTEPATGKGRILGTAPYMSPEQVQGQVLDHRSDVFSLGIILYEMATGERPFTGETWADIASSILRDTPTPLTERRADLPRELGRVVKRCVEKERQRRIQSVLDLRNELEELRQEADSGALMSAEQALKVTAPRRRARWVGAVVALAIVAAGLAGWFLLDRSQPAGRPPRTVPLTSSPGYEGDPALSPDGKQVAYIRNDGGDGTAHLYVKLVDGGDPLALTTGEVWDSSPAWSPDGTRIAFLRWTKPGRYDVLEIPALGGATRRLGTAEGEGLSWSPDGATLAMVDRPSPDEKPGISLVSTETGEMRRVVPAPPDRGFMGDQHPAFSPDGRSLAFVRGWDWEGGNQEIHVQPLAAEDTIRATSALLFVWDVEWAADGDSLMFSTGATLASSYLMRVPVENGSASRMSVGDRAQSFSVVGERLCYAEVREDRNIWRVSGPTSTTRTPPEPLIASTRDDMMPAYSPDGMEIAFVSDRAGTLEVWTADADGTSPRQLTDLGHAIWPRWSPSGRSLTLNSMQKGRAHVYVLDASGGIPESVIEGGMPDWSVDERWIYFTLPDGPIQKIPVRGGQPIQLTDAQALVPQRAPNNQVFFSSESSPNNRVWGVSADGGDPEIVLDTFVGWPHWCIWNRNLIFVHWKDDEAPSIDMLDLESRQTTELVSLPSGASPSFGLSVSPDGQWILYAQQDSSGSDLILVENFR